ncbi:EamA family transporter [Kutzneria kofuensis]|uniref:Inner membrane transporter RhtA n=1 Tax=Kutzneria kofuensis TaxID=103725 RepID=A0A7W9KL65_9PSEU|nr:EamA family transporter [Kutzneria kofuensis]MBB5894601.1 inner membrane transporter RhtA [Kutzneria kofuensis]
MVMVSVDGTSGRLPRRALGEVADRLLGSVPPTGLLLGGIVSVQLGAALAKGLFPVIGAAGTAGVRLVFAAVVLLAFWRPRLRMSGRAWLVVLGYGTVLGLMNLSIYEALQRLPLGIAVTIEFLGPLAIALAGSRRWLDALWALLAAAGVAMLADIGGDASLLGILFALAAAVCWAGYILLGAKLGEATAGGSGLAVAMAIGAVVIAPFGVAEAGSALLNPTILVIGAGVALLSSVIPYSLELEALRKIPPRLFGVLMSVEPAVAALAGVLVLGENLRPVQWLAIMCVVTASAGATYLARNK